MKILRADYTGTATPATKVHVVATTEQLRLAYDTEDYISATVANGGATTLATYTYEGDRVARRTYDAAGAQFAIVVSNSWRLRISKLIMMCLT